MKLNRPTLITSTSVVALIAGLLSFFMPGVGSQANTGQLVRDDLPVVDLSPEAQSRIGPESIRWVRNSRHDSTGNIIEVSRYVFKESDLEYLFETPLSHPEVSPIPAYSSDLIVVGRVSSRAAYLSNDRTRVYSEFEVIADQVVKNKTKVTINSETKLIVNRRGGAVRLPSGKVLRRGGLGERMPLLNSDYLFFLRFDKEASSYSILTAYEIRDGKVYPLDGEEQKNKRQTANAFAKYAGMSAQEFLDMVNMSISIDGDE